MLNLQSVILPLVTTLMLSCSHDHNADFTPRFEQYGLCLVNPAIDWLTFWDVLKLDSRVIGIQQQFQGAQGHVLGHSIYATAICSIVDVRGGSSERFGSYCAGDDGADAEICEG